MNLKKLRLGSLSKDDWLEFGKTALAIIGLLSLVRWFILPPRPYCKDMGRIRVEVEAMNEAVSHFDDGKTDLKDAVNKTTVQMRYLQAVVEECQCPDDRSAP